jgi:hypothetical protein
VKRPLRAKFCLDLRSEASIHSSLESIVDLVQPERRLRSELLQRLRKPGKADVATVAELREYANGPNHDQQLQIAALRGLAPIPGPEATLAVAERALNSWGIGAIHAANRILARRREYGGLLVLSAVLELDDRFLLEKKDLIVRQLRKSEDASAKHLAERFVEIDISSKKPSKREERLHSLLENCEIDDLRHGAVISRLIDSTSSRELHLPKPENIKIAAARTYSDTRIPGFLDLLSSTVNRLSSFLSPDSDRNRPQDHPFTIVLADTTSSMISKGGQPGRGR